MRHRGEPDGRTAPPPDAPPRTTTGALDCDLSATACYGNVSRLPGTATLNMSNKFGASRNDLQHQSYRSTHSKSDFRSGERPPVKISRPGGGGESDAAFTPSPPVALQRHISDQLSAINNPTNVTLALAHQTKIRNLYHATPGSNQTLMGARMMGRQAQNLTDMQMDAYGLNASILDGDIKSYAQAGQMQNQMGVSNSGLRPDSSSSASSATDWESSGHATVLRRAPLPPLPPPRLPPAPGPLVENLHPLPPVYNNLSTLAGAFAEGNSSDSDFERGFEQTLNTAMPLTAQPSGMANLQGRNNIKTLYKNTGTHRKEAQVSDASLERLSVRTELSSNIQAVTNAIANMSTTSRKAPALPTSEGSIYYSATEQSGPSRNLENNTLKKQTDSESQSVKSKIENIKQSVSKDIALSSSSKSGSSTIQSSSGSGSIQDSILASQLRHINRELTPTISEVYHERSIGLGLAPPLSKLLLNSNGQGGSGNNNSNNDSNMMTGLEKFGIIDENSIPEKDIIGHGNSSQVTRVAAECERFCDMCNRPVEQGSTVCACKNVVNISHKKPSNNSKPWLSGATSLHNNIQGPDLTTAEIIERQTKMKTHNVQEMGTMKSKNQTFADSIANSYSTEMTTIRHELTKTELIERDRRESVIASISAEIQNAGSAIKRAISPFSEMSRRDEGDGRSIADSHSSYNGVVISPQNSTPSCGSRQPMFSNNPSSEESDTMVGSGSGSSEALDKQGRISKSTHPRTKMKQQGVPQKQRSTFNLELIKDNHHCK